MAMRRIGQVLVDMGYIDDEQLDLLVDEQKQQPGQLIGRVAMDMGLIDEEKLARRSPSRCCWSRHRQPT